MSINYGKDYNYAHTRLSSTLVTTKDNLPMWVYGVSGTGLVEGKYTHTGKSDTIELEELVLTPPKIGLINSEGGSVTLGYRSPSRYWKQGICNKNWRWVIKNKYMPDIAGAMFGRAILGKYPTLTGAIELVVNGEVDSCAFSRDFYVTTGHGKNSDDVVLKYRDGPSHIGVVVDIHTGLIKLNEKFEYFKEMLEKEIGKEAA